MQLSWWHLSRQYVAWELLSISTISQLLLTWFWPNFLDPIIWEAFNFVEQSFWTKLLLTQFFCLFWTYNLVYSKFFRANIFGVNIFLDLHLFYHEFFGTKIFWTWLFFWTKFFWTKNIFVLTLFLPYMALSSIRQTFWVQFSKKKRLIYVFTIF